MPLILSQIIPANNSPFPTHEDILGKGGFITLNSSSSSQSGIQAKLNDLVLFGRRKVGMVVFDTNTDSYYRLIVSSSPGTNDQWKQVFTVSDIFNLEDTDLVDGNILKYSDSTNEWITSSSSIRINDVDISLGGSGNITASTPGSLSLGSGLSFANSSSSTSFNGSQNKTLAIDVSTIPLNYNNFFIGNDDGKVTEVGSTGTGSVVRQASPTISGTLSAENLVLSGNLIVNGTTTTINTNHLVVEDKNIELGFTTDASNASANGGGITLLAGDDGDKTLTWFLSTQSWTSSENFDLVTTKEYRINNEGVLKSNALGKGIFQGSEKTAPDDTDRLLIYGTNNGDWSQFITWQNLKSGLEAAISGVDVELDMPDDVFNVDKLPDTNGTLFQITFDNQSVNTIFAGPGSGTSVNKPTFRALVPADIPSLDVTKFTTGTLPVDRGGTGHTTYTNGELLIGNGTGNTLSKATLTAGTGIDVTNGAGSITIANSDRGSQQNIFKTITVGATNIVASANADTLTFIAGTGISLTAADKNITVNLSHLGIQNLLDPDADRILFWDDSAGKTEWLILGTNLSITGTTINATNTTYTAGTGLLLSGTVFSLNANLDDLLNVSITNVSGGNVLVYDETDGWINSDVIYGGNAGSF